MVVNTYINYSDNRKVKKSITPIKQYGCVLKDRCGVANPVIRIYDPDTDLYRANYAYIDTFGRYYYINNIVTTPEFLELEMSVDVLMSFQSAIFNLNTYIERQENVYNLYIADHSLPVRTERGLSYLKIGDLGNNSSILLTVTGAKESEEENGN